MSIGEHISEGLGPVVDLIYPPRCPSCGVAIASQGGLCVDCWSLLEQPSTAQEGGDGNERRIVAATTYNDTSRKLILAFKHGGKIALAPLLARMMSTHLPDARDEPATLVPVPLHRLRIWHRGYNQSALLALELVKLGKGEVLLDALIRRKRTPSLGGLGPEERHRVLRNAIIVRKQARERIVGRHVVLVDDVFTSGATSKACSRVLMEAGAAQVTIACFATAGRTNIQHNN